MTDDAHGRTNAADQPACDPHEAIAAMISAIRQLMNPLPPKRRGIGFTADIHDKS